MAVSFQIPASGMQAAQTMLHASAHNIANLQTDGFRRQQVVLEPVPGGGVSAGVVRTAVRGPDLVRDIVAQLQAKNMFLANVAVFRTQQSMAGVLLDERA